jgi:hypothetical protein
MTNVLNNGVVGHVEDVMTPPVAVADKAVDWIQKNIASFDPFRGKGQPGEYRQKALVELALLCLYLHGHPAFSRDARVQEFLRFIRDVYRNPYFREGMFRLGNLFVAHGYLAVVLRRWGLLGEGCDWQAIQGLIDHSNITLTEQLPFRALELRLLLSYGGFRHRLPSPEELFRRSMLSKPLNPLYVTDNDAYAITHTLFFLSDFGRHPIAVFSRPGARHAFWVVEHLLGMYVQRKNWDLVGELLLSCRCLRRTTSELYHLGWQGLSGAQLPDGAVPGPHYDPRRAEALEGEKKQDHLFEGCYHTTLVAAFAGALCPDGGKTDET